MGTPAATACRMARKPECEYVPPSKFVKTCFSSVRGCWPSHITPSAPMWEIALVFWGSSRVAIAWHPMPANARLPSITLVDRLWGQPEQKLGGRTGKLCGDVAAPSTGGELWLHPSSCRSTDVMAVGESSPQFGNTGLPRWASNAPKEAYLPMISGASFVP